jgi:hypothetical protein
VYFFNIEQPDDLSEFYKDESIREEENDYLEKMMDQHNRNVEININKPSYEEPVKRELNIKEEIPRLNPIDFDSYMITNNKGNTLTHLDRAPFKLNYNKNSNIQSNNFNIQQILKANKNEIDLSTKEKANTKVIEFLNEFKPKINDNQLIINIEKKKVEKTNNILKLDNKVEEDIEEKTYEHKGDDKKWKFNKNELYERKKKLLKDKSNLKKNIKS